MKYHGIKIDVNLIWKHQICGQMLSQLNRSNAISSKLRHFIDIKTLKSIYHANYNSRDNFKLYECEGVEEGGGVTLKNTIFI